MWPHRRRWSLMGSLAPPIPRRFGVATHEFSPEGTIPSPNYEVWDKESREWSADKNNAAINAAMARQAQTPQTSGAGGKSMAERVAEKLAKMEVPEHAGFDSPSPWGGKTQWGPQNFAHSPVGSLMNMTADPNDPRKRKGPY